MRKPKSKKKNRSYRGAGPRSEELKRAQTRQRVRRLRERRRQERLALLQQNHPDGMSSSSDSDNEEVPEVNEAWAEAMADVVDVFAEDREGELKKNH